MKNQLTLKVGFEGTPKIGPALEVTTSYLQSKHGVEIRIESVDKDNSHSRVRISHDLNKLVTDLIDKKYDDNEQETSTTRTEVFASASRYKAEAKPRRPSTACSSSRTVPIFERIWIDIEPRAQFGQAYPVAKGINTLLRHGELPREEGGAIEFWRLKDDLQNNFEYSQYWSDDVWKSKMAGGGGNKKIFQYCTDSPGQEILYLRAVQGHSGRNPIDGAVHFWRVKENLQNQFPHSPHWSDSKWKVCLAGGGGDKRRFQYCTDSSETIVYLRARQGHSGRNLIDLTLQDNVLIPNNFFEYIYHIGCAVNVHSITNSGLKAGRQNSSKDRQTVFFTAVNTMHKNHKDPQELDLTKPRLASYKQKWKVHQDTMYWVEKQLAQRKGLKFYQTRSCHLDHHRKFPTKIIGCAIWILILLEAAKTLKESNQNPKPNHQVREDSYVERKRKSRNVPRLIATLLIKRNMVESQTQQVRRDPYVDTNPQNAAC